MLAISKAISKAIGKPVAIGNRVGSITPQPDLTDLLAWYKTTIADGKYVAFKPESNHTTQQVKSSGFAGEGSATVTGLTTAHTFTATGDLPTCTVNGTLTLPGPDCCDVRAFLDGDLWAYWPGINIGQNMEADRSGNNHHLVGLVGAVITERTDGTGTNYRNETGKIAVDVGAPVIAECVGPELRLNEYQTFTGRMLMTALRDITGLRATYGNYYKDGTDPQEQPNTNSLTIKVALEYDGVTYPMYFGGVREKILAGGDVVSTDPIFISIPTDAIFYIRTYCDTGAAGNYYPYKVRYQGAGYGGYDSWVATTDSVDATGELTGKLPKGLLHPIGVHSAVPEQLPWVAVVGDSTVVTSDASYSGNGNALTEYFDYTAGPSSYWSMGGGWPSRYLRSKNIPSISVAFGSEAAGYFLGNNIAIRSKVINGATHWLVVDGRNDLTSGAVTAQSVIDKLTAIGMLALANHAVPVISTILPKSTGDSRSITEQTTDGNTNPARIAINDWARTVPYPFAGCIDVADAVETERNSGIWNVGPVMHSGSVSSADATHLSVDPAMFQNYALWNGFSVRITGGTGAGQIRNLSNNTTTTITISVAWETIPDATSTFEIFSPLSIDGVHPWVYGHYLISVKAATYDLPAAIVYPGPLGIDAPVQSGTTYPCTIKAPLGAEFQAIPEFTGEAAVDLATLVPTDYVRTGPKGTLVYRTARDASGILRADKVVGA